MKKFALILPLTLMACVEAKPAEEPVEKPYFWKLISIDGVDFPATATMAFSGDRVSGQAPCNAWSGDVIKTPFPETNIRNVVATMMACDNLAAEQQFFAAMAAMTHESVGFGHLELVDQKGREMKFVPLNP
jgi:heat shock protein HslJ